MADDDPVAEQALLEDDRDDVAGRRRGEAFVPALLQEVVLALVGLIRVDNRMRWTDRPPPLARLTKILVQDAQTRAE
jgi:hypothetical protein